ncbi:MAG: hypothetical protein ACI8PP_003194 [Candidatus Pseudothioglobus sp.]
MVIGVAEDTGGEAAAGQFIDAVASTYVHVIDEAHVISSLYNLVNVPSTVWIDERGQVVRIDEGSYAAKHALPGIAFGRDDYVTLVRDWVANGADSAFVKARSARQHLRVQTDDECLAEANFNLGVYFQRRKQRDKASFYMQAAARLKPDSWNYHRQDWIFDGEDAARSRWQKRRASRAEHDYYQPIVGLDNGKLDNGKLDNGK